MRIVTATQRWDDVNRIIVSGSNAQLYKRLDPSYQFNQRNQKMTDSDLRDDAAGINRDTALQDWIVNAGPGDLIATISVANILHIIDGGK